MPPLRRARISLKLRLFLPNLLYVCLIAVVWGLYFYSGSQMDSLGLEQRASMDLAGKVRQTALMTKGYLNKDLSREELGKQFQSLQAALAGSPLAAQFSKLWSDIEQFARLESANDGIEKRINELTSASIGQSSGYIKMISEKLAGEDTRGQVSKLERLVIIGANINTSSNYELKIKFLQLKDDLAVKQDMLKFIDTLMQNVEEDIKRLSGTPFHQMALAAKDANEKIKVLTLDYIKNVEGQNAIGQSILQSIEKSMADIETSTLTASQDFFAQTKGSYQLLVAVLVVIAILGMALGLFQARGIAGSLSRIIEGLGEVASGAARASDQVSQASQSLAQTTSQQAASLEETSSSMEEMSSMTRKNADNAGQADGMMKEAGGIVSNANRSMNELRKSMEKINRASDETAKIIKTIDEIAFQTNLLALNAAVEAARAGEAGAGFAVVADEVRNLAMRAAEAAKNTDRLIQENITDIRKGSENVVSTDEAFAMVQDSASKVAELVAEIAAASSEQAQGIEQVNLALSQMDKVTQQNAANAEESAAASEELRHQAQNVESLTQELMALLNGGKASASLAGRSGQNLLPQTDETEEDFS